MQFLKDWLKFIQIHQYYAMAYIMEYTSCLYTPQKK